MRSMIIMRMIISCHCVEIVSISVQSRYDDDDTSSYIRYLESPKNFNIPLLSFSSRDPSTSVYDQF